MTIQLLPTTAENKQVLKNLLQLYIHDFSEYVDCDVDAQGLFAYPGIEDYWTDKYKFPYLVIKNGKHAGFVLVKFMETPERNYFSIAEFFILKKYRRSGIGTAAATLAFNLHRGRWQVHQMDSNTPAQLFWQNVIAAYTAGRFSQRTMPGKTIQDFEN